MWKKIDKHVSESIYLYMYHVFLVILVINTLATTVEEIIATI